MKLTMNLAALLAEVKETVCIKNVHDPLYITNQMIINRMEAISGHKFKKTMKREKMITFIEGMLNNLTKNEGEDEMNNEVIVKVDAMDYNMINLLVVARVKDYVSDEALGQRIFKITGEVIKEGASRSDLIDVIKSYMAVDYDKMMAKNPNVVFEWETPEAETQRKTEANVELLKSVGVDASIVDGDIVVEDKVISEKPLYNKEETSEIGTKIMAKILVSALKIAKANRVKSFISDKMLDKVIDNCLFGVPFDADYKQRYYAMTKEQAVKASQVKKAVVARTMLAYKEGYIVKPYYMAWTYKNTILTYRTTAPGAVTIYELDVDNKIIINTKTKKSVALDKANCEYLNNMFLIGVNKSK